MAARVFVDIEQLDTGAIERLFRFGELFERKSEVPRRSPAAAAAEANHGAVTDRPSAKAGGDESSSFWEATMPARSARGVGGLSADVLREISPERERRANKPYQIFKRRKPFEIGPKQCASPPRSARIGLQTSTYAHAVAAGAYTLAFEAVVKRAEEHIRDDDDNLAEVALSMRERTVPVSAWDEPVRVHTQELGAALGIDWAKYMSRIDTQRAQAKKNASPQSSGRGSASARGTPASSSRDNAIYTRDGRRIDMSMRSEQEALLIERVQGHSSMAPPSASHPSVAKYVSEDGKSNITPGSTTITPRSVSLTPRASGATPRSARSSHSSHGVTPRHESFKKGDQASALAPTSFGLEQAPSIPSTGGSKPAKQQLAPKDKTKLAPKVGSPRRGGGGGCNSSRGGQPSALRSDGGGGSFRDGAPGQLSMAEREAQTKAKLEEGLAAARAKRQIMSRPLRQALSSKIDSAATLTGEGDRAKFVESEEWRDDTFKRTHIDYRALKSPKRGAMMSHTLHDIQASTISLPLQNPEHATQGATSSVAVAQGSNAAAPAASRHAGGGEGGAEAAPVAVEAAQENRSAL